MTISQDVAAEHVAEVARLRPGDEVGRYRILRRLGHGGTATVFEALDPALDRSVALKILHSGGRGPDLGTRERMLREARAVASVSHPNVVSVYDAGLYNGLVYIALELAPGTLSGWLDASHQWPRILDVFLAAGRGLQSAHEAGLVHRDFKPANVLVFDDGRACVADFGLAGGSGRVDGDPQGVQTASSVTSSSRSVTRDLRGLRVGTPGFMSPEQYRAEPADARSDQFSFCVALYGALFGQRPFAGTSEAERQRNIERGRLLPPPTTSRVPGWIAPVLARGLDVDREKRWASMGALLRKLRRRRRRGSYLVLGAGVPMAVAAAFALGGPETPQTCEGGSHALARVWGEQQRAAVSPFVRGADDPVARAWSETEGRLDAFAADWLGVYREVCRSTGADDRDRGDRDSRLSCLAGQLEGADALVRAAATGRRAAILEAPQRARRMPAPAQCRDSDYAALRIKPPEAPERRLALETLRERLAEVASLRSGGSYHAALGVTESLGSLVEFAGYPPIEARVDLERGRLHLELDQREQASTKLEKAYFGAAECGEERVQLDAALALVRLSAKHLGDHEASARWRRLALASAARLGGVERLVEVRLAEAEASSLQGRSHDALELYQRALVLSLEASGDDGALAVAEAHEGLGRQYLRTGDYEQAAAELGEALDLKRNLLGEDHPRFAQTLSALGVLAAESGRRDEAAVYYRESLSVLESVYGEDHPKIAPVLQNLGNIEMKDEPVTANARLVRALKLRESALGADNPVLAGLHVAVGNSYRVLHIQDPSQGTRLDSAERHYSRAAELGRASDGRVPYVVLYSHAMVAWSRGDFHRAARHARDMVESAALDADADIVEVQRLKIGLARLLWDGGVELDFMDELVKTASASLLASGQDYQVELLDEWVATRPEAGAMQGPNPLPL